MAALRDSTQALLALEAKIDDYLYSCVCHDGAGVSDDEFMTDRRMQLVA